MKLNDYRFLSDEEPTDEQLEMLMREVGDEARAENAQATKEFMKQVHLEVERAHERESTKTARE